MPSIDLSHDSARRSAAARGTSAPRRATIAFVHSGADWIRGSEQCLLDLASRLDRSRFQPLVICNAPTLRREAERLGLAAIQEDFSGGGPRTARAVRDRAHDILRAHNVALVHANIHDTIATLVPAVRRLRVPLIAHLHLPLSPVQSERLWLLVHQVTVAVGVADHVVEPLRADGMAPQRLRVIHNAVDAIRLSRGDATTLRARLGIAKSAFVIGSVGSLITRKGHDVSIRGVAAARARGIDVHLLLCGDGTEESELQALAVEQGVADAVHFLGVRSDPGAVLRDATDICLSSARQEALPLNVLEAQWLGVPVVVSDIPAHHEAVVDGTTAVIVPVEAPEALAETLVQLSADYGRRRALGYAGREFAHAHFSMERYVAEFDALYSELLTRPRSSNGWFRGTAWPASYTPWLIGMIRRRFVRDAAT